MRAFKTKQNFFLCTYCGGNRDVSPTFVVELYGPSTVAIAAGNPDLTYNAPDSSYAEELSGRFSYSSLNCASCRHPIAQWNRYMDETTEVKIHQISNFPLNGTKFTPVWECGNCEAQYFEDEEAEECCL